MRKALERAGGGDHSEEQPEMSKNKERHVREIAKLFAVTVNPGIMAVVA
jgi:hypothetical protein